MRRSYQHSRQEGHRDKTASCDSEIAQLDSRFAPARKTVRRDDSVLPPLSSRQPKIFQVADVSSSSSTRFPDVPRPHGTERIQPIVAGSGEMPRTAAVASIAGQRKRQTAIPGRTVWQPFRRDNPPIRFAETWQFGAGTLSIERVLEPPCRRQTRESLERANRIRSRRAGWPANKGLGQMACRGMRPLRAM